jgi:hypothetical protein
MYQLQREMIQVQLSQKLKFQLPHFQLKNQSKLLVVMLSLMMTKTMVNLLMYHQLKFQVVKLKLPKKLLKILRLLMKLELN